MADSLRVAVIDYDAGNTLSVTRALQKAGAAVELTSDPDRVTRAEAVVLPGVGAFGDCVKKLAERGMDDACREAYAAGKPFLGVCVGLQVLFEGSEESPGIEGLGILPGTVRRLAVGNLKVPHMGWNDLRAMREHRVLEGLDGESFYFVHSFYPEPDEESDLLATSDYGAEFCAAAGRENLAAVQFHPEKSSRAGLKLYENFLAWGRSS